MNSESTNFTFLGKTDAALAEIISWAEIYLPKDPNTCVIKIGQFAELLAQKIAATKNVYHAKNETQCELIIKLKSASFIDEYATELFHKIREARNEAVHGSHGDYDQGLIYLRYAHQLAVWYYKRFVDYNYVNIEFIPPTRVILPSNLQIRKSYEKVLYEIQNKVNILNDFKKKERQCNADRATIQRRREKLEQEVIECKKQADMEREKLFIENDVKKNKLQQKMDRLDLELIRIEIQVSDLRGFESTSEIRLLLNEQERKRAVLEQKRKQLDFQLTQIPKKTTEFNILVAQKFRKLNISLRELGDLKVKQDNYETEVRKDIKKHQEEIKNFCRELKWLINDARRQNLQLPPIPDNILFVIRCM